MMEVILVGLACFSGLILLWVLSVYNRLIMMEQDVMAAWSNIDVVLQERYDSLSSMAKSAERFANDVEKDLFEQFAKVRMSAAKAASSGNVGGVNAAEGMMASLMPKIVAIAEDHPEVTSGELYIKVQEEIDEQNERIADRRESYNSKVRNWNIIIQQIPTNFVAMIAGKRQKEYFEAANTENPDLFEPNAEESMAKSREIKQESELDAIEHEIAMLEAQKRLEEARRK
jgi:LemA protein|tara:strand:- start:704 stop:1390 length:687 start_codon:yes stop_codon:yes gene_type:complete